jgi:hypothetical protein
VAATSVSPEAISPTVSRRFADTTDSGIWNVPHGQALLERSRIQSRFVRSLKWLRCCAGHET